jgi:methionyl-tRNA formyltransferase
MNCRIIFFGTAELARASLAALSRCDGFEVAAVVTQPDKPKGRDLRLQPTPVKAEALALGLPVHQPPKARAAGFVEQLAAWKPDLIVVVAYGQILPQTILDIPRFGCLNVHTSLLPKYRGAAPIQWAILDGQPETGVTVMQMDAGLDTGAILAQQATPIQAADDSQTLHDRLAQMGARLLVETIPAYIAGKIQPRAQPEECASYARKISKEDGRLDWSQPARALWNRIRAFTPWPGAFTLLPDETKLPLLKIWEAEPDDHVSGSPGEVLRADKGGFIIACAGGSLRILQLQREGGRRLRSDEFLTGYPIKPGMLFL